MEPDGLGSAWGAVAVVAGVAGVWGWRWWLIRDDFRRPSHDWADDALWVLGSVGAVVAYGLLTPSTRWAAPNVLLVLLVLLAGLWVLRSGLRHRTGRTLHCERCNYQIVDTSAPRRCPECASVWAHALSHGRVQPNRTLMGLGLGLIALALAGMVMQTPGLRGVVRSQTPTAWLVSSALTGVREGAWLETGIWVELSRRRLSDIDARALAGAITSAAEAGTLRDRRAEDWLEAEAMAGRLPGDVAVAFLARSLQFRLVASGQRDGEVRLTLRAVPLRRLEREKIAVTLDKVEEVRADGTTIELRSGGTWELLGEAMGTLPTVDPTARLRAGSNVLGEIAAAPAFPSVLETPTAGSRAPVRRTFRVSVWTAIVPDGDVPTGRPHELLASAGPPTMRRDEVFAEVEAPSPRVRGRTNDRP